MIRQSVNRLTVRAADSVYYVHRTSWLLAVGQAVQYRVQQRCQLRCISSASAVIVATLI